MVLCACTVSNPLAKARGLILRTGAQTMLYLSLILIDINSTNDNCLIWVCSDAIIIIIMVHIHVL